MLSAKAGRSLAVCSRRVESAFRHAGATLAGRRTPYADGSFVSTIRFLADHDLNEHIVAGIRRREPAIEILRVRDLGLQNCSDAELLDYAHEHQLLVISQT